MRRTPHHQRLRQWRNRAPETPRPRAWAVATVRAARRAEPVEARRDPVEPEASPAARRRTAASHDQRQETEPQDTPAHSSAASPSGRIGHTAKNSVEPSHTPWNLPISYSGRSNSR